MKLTFDQSQCFSVSRKLHDILNGELAKLSELSLNSHGITFNFRDEEYSPDTGGFHPVELRVVKHGSIWQFEYITDFSYQGYPYPELVREIDICFQTKQVYCLYGGVVSKNEGDELVKLLVTNFICYVESDIFNVHIKFD